MHCSYKCLGPDCKPCMQVCEKFLHEFPDWWQRCKLLYPKLTNTDTAPDASNSGEDSTQFYLDQFERGKRLHLEGTYLISKFDGIFKSFSHNDAVFQKSSHLLNGKPRFEEYTCDGDIATDENPAASSKAATGKCRRDYLDSLLQIFHFSDVS